MALAILRLAGEDARKERTGRLIVQVPISVATYLVNEKRAALRDIEEKCGVELVLVPNKDMETPEFSLRRVRADELGLAENSQASYKMPTPAEAADVALQAKRPPAAQAAVTTIIPTAPAPAPLPAEPEPVAAPVVATVASPRRGLLGWMKTALFGDAAPEAAPPPEPAKPAHRGERKGLGERDRERGGRDRDRNARRGREDRDGDRSRGDRDRKRGHEGRPGRGDGDGSRNDHRQGDQKPRREQTPQRKPDSQPVAPAAPMPAAAQGTPAPAVAADGSAQRADSERRSRRGGRRRRGRGGRGGEAGALAGGEGMHEGMDAESGAPMPGSQPRLDFSESRPAPEHRAERAPDANSSVTTTEPTRAAPPPPPPPPPPPERPAVVWSSSGAGSLGGSDRSQRDE
jgi:ribonuclease E